jgi:predicted glycosyltransferase
MTTKRVLVYSHDTFGLGNIRRMLAIAHHLVASHKNINVLLLSGSPMLHAFRLAPGIDYIKLPCLVRTTNGKYAVKFLDINFKQTIRLRANLIVSALLDFEPDLILVDKKPLGVSNELLPAFNIIARRSDPPRMALVLRDILDDPVTTAGVWRKNGYHSAVSSFYDRVLVVGSRNVFDVGKEYRFPPSTVAKLRYCGYVGREAGRRSREGVRAEMGADELPLVLVTVGGGEDGYGLLSTYLAGLRDTSASKAFRSLIVIGPEMSAEDRLRIAASASLCSNVTTRDFTDDIMSYMAAADVVVSMGGYNTVCEILTLRKRAVIVPRINPVSEQLIRAQRLAALGVLRYLHPDELTPQLLMHAVQEELLAGNRKPADAIDINALDRVRSEIVSLLYTPPVCAEQALLAEGFGK